VQKECITACLNLRQPPGMRHLPCPAAPEHASAHLHIFPVRPARRAAPQSSPLKNSAGACRAQRPAAICFLPYFVFPLLHACPQQRAKEPTVQAKNVVEPRALPVRGHPMPATGYTSGYTPCLLHVANTMKRPAENAVQAPNRDASCHVQACRHASSRSLE